MASPEILDTDCIIAGPGFNRWLGPPAGLAIHLCFGMAYGFQVFWLPPSKSIGIKEAVKCGPDIGFWSQLFTSMCDWQISTLGWMYTLFLVLLGSSAAIWGSWLAHTGPRKAGGVWAVVGCGGLLIGVSKKFGELGKSQLGAIAPVAAGFTALLSLLNNGGRFFWASLSDTLGRKRNYVVSFVLGAVLCFRVPSSAEVGSIVLFVATFCTIRSMYGGSFATVAVALAWIATGLPLAWDVYRTLLSVTKFFA